MMGNKKWFSETHTSISRLPFCKQFWRLRLNSLKGEREKFSFLWSVIKPTYHLQTYQTLLLLFKVLFLYNNKYVQLRILQCTICNARSARLDRARLKLFINQGSVWVTQQQKKIKREMQKCGLLAPQCVRVIHSLSRAREPEHLYTVACKVASVML